MKMGSIHAQA